MNLPETVDAYNLARKERLRLKEIMEQQEAIEQGLKKQLIEGMQAAGATAMGGKTAVVKLVRKNEPTVSDWDKYYAHIRATGEFELLYRRINPKSIKERKDVGVDVPGIDWIPVDSLSLSQI